MNGSDSNHKEETPYPIHQNPDLTTASTSGSKSDSSTLSDSDPDLMRNSSTQDPANTSLNSKLPKNTDLPGPFNTTYRILADNDDIIKPVSEQGLRFYRYLELQNKMHVVLVSDSRAKQAHVNMRVGVGYNQAPPEVPSLAHVLERMLGVRNHKNPILEPDGFTNLVRKHGGYTNARTGADMTRFNFEVSDDEGKATSDSNSSESDAQRILTQSNILPRATEIFANFFS